MKNESSSRLVVRQPRNLDELEALLRLRYTVFQQSELRFLLHDNAFGLDVDAWDKLAWHFGLYKQTSDGFQLIGYMRFIHNGPQCAHLVYALGRKYPALAGTIAKAPSQSFPLLARSSRHLSPDVLHRFESMPPGKLVETSRFVLLDSEKSPITCRFMVQAATTFCLLNQGVETIFQVSAHHATCYERFGYRPIIQYKYEELPYETVLIHASLNNLEQKNLPRLHRMAAAFEAAQEIWYNPDEPENYHAPTNTETPAYQLSALNEV